jgi:hypothetical protein
MRSLACALALAVLLAFAGCGGDDENGTAASDATPGSTPMTTATTTPQTSRIVKQADVADIDLGTARAKILKRFGTPVGTPSNETQTCLVYATDAGSDTWERFCFVHDKLVNLATVVGRDTALTLTPPSAPPKGPSDYGPPPAGKTPGK